MELDRLIGDPIFRVVQEQARTLRSHPLTAPGIP